MKKIKKIGALSLGKILGIMYAIMGLIFGGLITIAAVLGNTFFAQENSNVGAIIFGLGAIIFIPIIYGFLGFILGIISAWIFNKAAKWVGGLEIELQD